MGSLLERRGPISHILQADTGCPHLWWGWEVGKWLLSSSVVIVVTLASQAVALWGCGETSMELKEPREEPQVGLQISRPWLRFGVLLLGFWAGWGGRGRTVASA